MRQSNPHQLHYQTLTRMVQTKNSLFGREREKRQRLSPYPSYPYPYPYPLPPNPMLSRGPKVRGYGEICCESRDVFHSSICYSGPFDKPCWWSGILL